MALRVAIVGPGALGRALGGVLERGGTRVCYVGRARDEHEHEHELALVTVKAYDTAAAIEAAAPLLGEAPVVSLQNGLGNVEAIAGVVEPARVFAGSTTHAARRRADGEVEHVAHGETRIAPYSPESLALGREVAEKLTAHGLPTSVEPDWRPLVWRKLAIVAGILGVGAARRIENGAILADPAAFAEASAAAEEALGIARDLGIAVEGEGTVLVRAVCERTARNRSSMLQDIEADRRPELDAIHGAILRVARSQLNRDAPANRALLARLTADRVMHFIRDENPSHA